MHAAVTPIQVGERRRDGDPARIHSCGTESGPSHGNRLVLGVQLAVDLYDCPPHLLADRDKVRDAMVGAALAGGATVVTETFHQFNPHGISGVVVIAESHLAIHTWPEHGYAAIDLFTCGDKVKPWLAVESLRRALSAGRIETVEHGRGLLSRLGTIPKEPVH